MTWRSGARSGRIAVDNGGEGYTIVADSGVPHYLSGSQSRWTRLRLE